MKESNQLVYIYKFSYFRYTFLESFHPYLRVVCCSHILSHLADITKLEGVFTLFSL